MSLPPLVPAAKGNHAFFFIILHWVISLTPLASWLFYHLCNQFSVLNPLCMYATESHGDHMVPLPWHRYTGLGQAHNHISEVALQNQMEW